MSIEYGEATESISLHVEEPKEETPEVVPTPVVISEVVHISDPLKRLLEALGDFPEPKAQV
jgi:hypothetical protein